MTRGQHFIGKNDGSQQNGTSFFKTEKAQFVTHKLSTQPIMNQKFCEKMPE
jgi:hypothetical protein